MIHYMKPGADYDNFAWLYNQEWTEFTQSIFPLLKYLAGKSLHRGAEVLDLCCGTGQLAQILTENGLKVTGIDISAGQLHYARKNAPEARFIKADARSFKLSGKFDAVFCTFDALNHILRLEEIQLVFNNVSRCLKSGGVFIFDLNTIKEFLSHWDDRQSNTEKPGYYYAVNIRFDREKRLGEFHVTMFRQSGKNWKRFETTICETFYPRPTVFSALKKAGFTDIETFAANAREGITTPGKNATRIYYRAVKA
jgi:SAM-dependent methyltransferase